MANNATKNTEEVKPEVTGQINIKVRDAEGNEVQFKIKRNTLLKRLTDAYCSRMSVGPGSYRFLFDGHRINDTDTPEGLDMQELDCIDAMVTQLGGIVHDLDFDAGFHADEDDTALLNSLWFVTKKT